MHYRAKYLAWIASWSEFYFNRWAKSGYRDFAAHNRWLELRSEWMRVKHLPETNP